LLRFRYSLLDKNCDVPQGCDLSFNGWACRLGKRSVSYLAWHAFHSRCLQGETLMQAIL